MFASLCAENERRRNETTLVVQCHGGGDGTHGVRSSDLVHRGSRSTGVRSRYNTVSRVERKTRRKSGRDAIGREDCVAEEANGNNRNSSKNNLRIKSGRNVSGIANNYR